MIASVERNSLVLTVAERGHIDDYTKVCIQSRLGYDDPQMWG